MTAIIAVKKGGKVSIGSDSLGSSTYLKQNYGTKLIKGSNFTVGYSASYRMAGILEDNLDDFKAPKKWDIKEARRFAEWFRSVMLKYGAKKEGEDGELPKHPVLLIMATKSKIFHIGYDYAVLESRQFAATGSGNMILEGAAHALFDTNLDASEIVYEAIEAACDLSPSCGKPIHVEDL